MRIRNGAEPQDIERAVSLLIGGALVLDGLSRRGAAGAAEAAAGGMLAIGALTGRTPVSHRLGEMRGAGDVDALPAKQLLRVHRAFTVARPADELYPMWRSFERLPSFMTHLESVTDLGEGRSRWVASGPLGTRVEWVAEVTHDEPGRQIAWRSLAGSELANTGSVRFEQAPGDRGTEVHVSFEYAPPAGAAGNLLAKLFGASPERTIQEDLRRFKQLAEAGEIATTEGQPSGRVDHHEDEGEQR